MKRFFSLIAAFAVSALAFAAEHINSAVEGYAWNSGLILGAVPGSAEMNRYRVTDPNQSETIRQRLYDHLLYVGAGQLQLSFFSQMVGQGITTAPGGVVSSVKSYADTNMDQAGTLPSGKQYLIESIEVYFYPGSSAVANTFTPVFSATTDTAALAAGTVSAASDVQAFYESGLLEFNVLDKNQLRETPLRSFPPKTWFDLDAAAAATTVAATSLWASHGHVEGRPYIMDPQISLQAAQNFRVNLSWPAAYALPSTKNARVGVYFDGFMQRAAQ